MLHFPLKTDLVFITSLDLFIFYESKLLTRVRRGKRRSVVVVVAVVANVVVRNSSSSSSSST